MADISSVLRPSQTNIEGVEMRRLESHEDERGSLTELFRDSWFPQRPVQWNFVRSEAGTLRGVHGHFRHSDYLVFFEGTVTVGLRDLRPSSPTRGKVDSLLLEGDDLNLLTIPPGVAHGFYFHAAAMHVYSVTHYWDAEDELGCRWDDPELGMQWPCSAPRISERDRELPPFAIFNKQMTAKISNPEKCLSR